MTPQTVGAGALIRFVQPRYYSLMTAVYIGSPYIALLSFACGDVIERNSLKTSLRFLQLTVSFLDSAAVADLCVVSSKWTRLQLLICVGVC